MFRKPRMKVPSVVRSLMFRKLRIKVLSVVRSLLFRKPRIKVPSVVRLQLMWPRSSQRPVFFSAVRSDDVVSGLVGYATDADSESGGAD
ncbi:hypothetical protein AK812_SmicGene35624 [Symbiodinium microadriaticum]|uniref:Uncharacterized protein n=1 Tax=Symbiodinium microadriaticum TaxID=2951 RepID=A0A1Q9CL00_SYMMI|nr:hypothetical protein AK812_SmicGene35624 [Symbiodinium microadriaticum]